MKFRQFFRIVVLMMIAMFCIIASAPIAAPLDPNDSADKHGAAIQKNGNAASCCQYSSQTELRDGTAACQASAKQEAAKPAASKTNGKSVLDAEVLESPFSFFKDYSSPDNSDAAPQPNAIMMMAKALAAILLSTIL